MGYLNTGNGKRLVMLNGDEALPATTPAKGSLTAGFVGMGADLFTNIFTTVSDNRTRETLDQMKLDDKRITNELTVALKNADASASLAEKEGYMAQIQALQLQQAQNNAQSRAVSASAPRSANMPVIIGAGVGGALLLALVLKK